MMNASNGVYTLYLDESKMRIGQKNEVVYCVAGIIVHESQTDMIRRRLKALKNQIWSGDDQYSPAPSFRSIHQAEVRNPSVGVMRKLPYMQVFRSRTKQALAIHGVGSLIEEFELPVMGAVINEQTLAATYGSHQDSYTAYYTALKVIVEAFALFLLKHDGHGRIILESRATATGNVSDQRVKKSFYKVMTNGTLRYAAIELQQLILGVAFVAKTQNDVGVQLADYVPRAFLYAYCGLVQPKPSIYQILRRQRYDGGERSQIDRYTRHGIVIVD